MGRGCQGWCNSIYNRSVSDVRQMAIYVVVICVYWPSQNLFQAAFGVEFVNSGYIVT